MTTLVLDREQLFVQEVFESDNDGFTADVGNSNRMDAYGGLTLDDLITGVWEGLAVRDTVHCPACGGTMVSRCAPQGASCQGDCIDCGARLS
jgi:hypothetical protein